MGRPERYLASAAEDKEALARAIAAQDGVETGLVCLLSSVEPCRTFDVYRNREMRQLELVARTRKCLFLYQYWIHPEFGFMNARIQTWFPFSVQVCLNGREWLARQMDRVGLQYVRQDNCFPWGADWDRAQRLLDAQRRTPWPQRLDRIARALNPVQRELFRLFPVRYYWTTYQSEWAIDVVFRRVEALRRLYPRLVHYAMTVLQSRDILRYLGRPVRLDGEVPKSFRGEMVSDLKWREEGVRIKHSVEGNSVKAYDKASTVVGSVLRAEATMQQTEGFRVYRRKEGDRRGPRAWRVLRRGVADLHRRATISETVSGCIGGGGRPDDRGGPARAAWPAPRVARAAGTGARSAGPGSGAARSDLPRGVHAERLPQSGSAARDLRGSHGRGPRETATLGMGQPPIAPVARPRRDSQNYRHLPLSIDRQRPARRWRDSRCPARYRPRLAGERRMKFVVARKETTG